MRKRQINRPLPELNLIVFLCILVSSLNMQQTLAAEKKGKSSGTGHNQEILRLPKPPKPEEVRDIIKAIADETASTDQRLLAIRYSVTYPYQDVVNALISALEVESEKSSNKINFNLVYSLVSALGELATKNDFSQYRKTIFKFNDYVNRLDEHRNEALYAVIETADRQLKLRDYILPSLTSENGDTKSESERPEQSLKEQLDEYQQIVESELFGQQPVVEKMTRLRAHDLFYGYRDNPPFLWFLGPQGAGKDTAVKAHVKALHPDLFDEEIEDYIYRVNPLTNEQDLNSFLGSSVGYIGSDNMPGILQFLVHCSAGRYKIQPDPASESSGRGPKLQIVENDLWQPGIVLPNYVSPQECVIYLDDFHLWSSALKNLVVKKAVEYGGLFQIKNPNNGLESIRLPITIIAASKDGEELVTSRQRNGQRLGKALTYAQQKRKADLIRNNVDALRASILSGNESSSVQNAKGTSEQFLRLIPEDHLFYFDPLSDETRFKIAEKMLSELKRDIRRSRSGFGKINLSWTPEVVTLIQSYHHLAEDQAHPIKKKVRYLIEETIIQAAIEGQLPKNADTDAKIDVIKNADNTWSLQFQLNGKAKAQTDEQKLFSLPIAHTEKDKFKAPISDERIKELQSDEAKMHQKIVGQKHAITQIAKANLLAEAEGEQKSASESNKSAQIVMALGPTSTGKTETAKALAELKLGDRGALVNISCTGVQSAAQMREIIYGTKDSQGRGIPSSFIQHHIKHHGRLVVALDEAANAPLEALNALFDILREAEITVNVDGTEQSLKMENVIIIITGNASQEILRHLPHDLPDDVLREAWADIYDRLEVDPFFRRQILERYFTPPFIARVGDPNIFFYKPLNYADVRMLTQMKLEQLIDQMAPTPTVRGWHVRFANQDKYMKTLEALETHGFIVNEQGASIDNYVSKVFGRELKLALINNFIPQGEQVTVELESIKAGGKNSDVALHKLNFKVQTEGGKLLRFTINGKALMYEPRKLQRDQLITAAHEAGHAIVGMALLSDFQVPSHIRILPGVTEINGQWVFYDGVASSERMVQPKVTLEYILREVAVLLGGTVAENLVIEGGINSAGRSNDIERATKLLETAILKWGMSKKFGIISRDKNDLSGAERAILRSEILRYLSIGEDLAKHAIMANRNSFVELTNGLASSGLMYADQMQKAIRKAGGLVRETDENFETLANENSSAFNHSEIENRVGMNYKFVKTLGLIPETQVADISAIVKKKKKKELAAVQLPDNLSIVGRPDRSKSSACVQALNGEK